MSSEQNTRSPQMLVSQLLLEDADLRDVVEEFVAGLQGRLEELRTAHQQHNFDMLTTLAHRLKGAAGSYGYPEISQLCSEMEQAFRKHTAEHFTDDVQKLNDMVAAARAGLEQTP